MIRALCVERIRHVSHWQTRSTFTCDKIELAFEFRMCPAAEAWIWQVNRCVYDSTTTEIQRSTQHMNTKRWTVNISTLRAQHHSRPRCPVSSHLRLPTATDWHENKLYFLVLLFGAHITYIFICPVSLSSSLSTKSHKCFSRNIRIELHIVSCMRHDIFIHRP